MRRLAELFIAARWWLLGLATVGAIAAWYPARRLAFDRSIENMFAANDPLLVSYGRLRRAFGGNEIVLAVYRDDALLAGDGRGIRRVAQMSRRLKAVPGVRDVLSLNQLLATDDDPDGLALAAPDEPLAPAMLRLFAGYTHSVDGRIASLVCMLEPQGDSSVPRETTIDALRDEMRNLPDGLAPGMLAGEPVMVTDGFRAVEADGRRLGWASTLLLAVVIVLCFRSLRWVIVPLAVVQLTLLLTDAVLASSGLALSMVSSMLTAIVTVVGIATVIHLVVRFRAARLEGEPPRAALATAGGLLAAPIFWSCATDAVGFGSLLYATVGPVRDFGLMTALGALLVLVSVVLVVPGLSLAGSFDTDPRRAWGEGLLDRSLGWPVHWARRRPWLVGVVAAAVSALAGAGMARLEVETDFTRNFRAGSRVVESYEFVETHLGGAGVWDVVLPAGRRLDFAYLKKVQVLEERLRREVVVTDESGNEVPGLTKVLSLSDAVFGLAPIDLDRVTFGREALVSVALATVRRRIPTFVAALHAEDPERPGKYVFRIMLRARERQPAEAKKRLIDQVTRISREAFPETGAEPAAEVTGFFVLLAHIIHSLVRDQWVTFGIASLGIVAMLALALRSPVLAVIALIPNALPIFVVLGLLGWSGLKLNMGAAMIAAVSMGLAVDSSIHYLTSFRRARAAGQDPSAALATVHQSVGRAMFFSTLALVVGFSVLCGSEFVPTIYFGALVSLSMLGGLAGNLVLLPALVVMVEGKGKHKDDSAAAATETA
jgi:predicted RND superfamily exporter protein